MHKFSIEDKLLKLIKKLSKKDKDMYNILFKKINEIVNSENINHYKNLKKPLPDFKRVHIKSSFVLIFQYNESDDKIIFYDLDHHDNIYK